MSDIYPPIPDRTTEQLLEIVETKEQWRDDVLELARQELIKRGFPVKVQETRRTIRSNFQKRIEKAKERSSFTALEKLFIFLFGVLLITWDLTFFYSGPGYTKKNRQGFFYFITGIGFWFLVFFICFKIKG